MYSLSFFGQAAWLEENLDLVPLGIVHPAQLQCSRTRSIERGDQGRAGRASVHLYMILKNMYI